MVDPIRAYHLAIHFRVGCSPREATFRLTRFSPNSHLQIPRRVGGWTQFLSWLADPQHRQSKIQVGGSSHLGRGRWMGIQLTGRDTKLDGQKKKPPNVSIRCFWGSSLQSERVSSSGR